LTPEARDYLPGVRAAFNDLRLATERLLRRENDHVLTSSTLASLAEIGCCRAFRVPGGDPGIDVRITTSTGLVDFKNGDVDAAIRYGRGHWPGLRARLADGRRTVSGVQPCLAGGKKPLRARKICGPCAASLKRRQ